MSIFQISKIQVRSGNIDQLPQLSVGEFGWATDTYQLFIGNNPNVIGPHPDNTEILTQYSKIEIHAAGEDMNVQYNENGVIAGSNKFNWSNGTSTLSILGKIEVNTIDADTIYVNTLIAGSINIGSLTVGTVTAGTIDAGTISGDNIQGRIVTQDGVEVLDVNSIIYGGTWG